MQKFKQIHVALVWPLELSHSIHQGICDYAKLRPLWEIIPIPLNGLSFETISKWNTDGMIAALVQERYKVFENARYPVVSTHASSQIPDSFPQVDEDLAASARLAAETLQRLGHEHFACIYSAASAPSAQFFVSEVEKLGFKVSTFITEHIRLDGSEEEVAAWLKSLPKPLALFSPADAVARSTLKLCLMQKIAVPDDVAILGGQNDRLLCEGITPAISSIELPYRRIGYEAARTLDQMMQGKKIKKVTQLFPPERIVRRASTDTLAVPDPHLRRAVQYIRAHVDEPFDVHALSLASGLSLRVLQNRFQKELNRTPREESQRAKVDRIKELLISTDLTLGEIAEQTSFSTEYYLGSIFKRYARSTPGQFRKHHRLR